ncbi:hypothetical protein C0Z16_02070 [Paraburkholderia rhynchosiae]|uniref:Uncharacterized protein n=1 Tax=Paraburkholderia rhynchosiae TaxID=487049 RepID=A0ABX4VFR9_9BURK|nr:hypothetical protein C0Z16_02070 [Paraburkholderia rhynchosiae]
MGVREAGRRWIRAYCTRSARGFLLVRGWWRFLELIAVQALPWTGTWRLAEAKTMAPRRET